MGQHFWLGVFTFANTLLVTLLALNVSRLRIKEKVANGDGGFVSLKKAIRAHGNGVEHLVVAGVQVLALDVCGAPPWGLASLVIAFTASRLLHALSMLASRFRLRQLTALGTYLSELGGAVAVLWWCVLS